VFVSYSHDSPGHMDRVLALCDRLRHDGVDTELDQYESAPPAGWPRWTQRQIETTDFVLVVCTEVYRRRFDGREEKGRGLAVKWEGAVMTQVLYDAAAETGKLVPLVFSPEDEAHIPIVLRGLMHYDLGSDAGYEPLYRHLTQQPAVAKPGLGALVALPAKSRASGFTSTVQGLARRYRWPWLAAAALLAVVLALVGYRSFGPAPKPQAAMVEASAPGPPAKQILSGEILDAETGLPLPGVLVSLPEFDLTKTTSPDGKYRFAVAVPVGTQVRIRATLEGYRKILADPPAGSPLNTHRMWRDR